MQASRRLQALHSRPISSGMTLTQLYIWCRAALQPQVIRSTGIRHKGEVADGIRKDEATTIAETCQAVRQLIYPSSKTGNMQRRLSATVITARAALAAAAALAVFGTCRGQAGAVPVVVIGLAAALLAAPLVRPSESCVITTTSSSLPLPVDARAAGAAVAAGIASVIEHSRAATCGGCMTALVELPPNSSCPPKQLLDWAKQLSQQVTTPETRPAAAAPPPPEAQLVAAQDLGVVAVCSGGGLVAWCQQGWGVCLPPAAGLPTIEIGSRVLYYDGFVEEGDCRSNKRHLGLQYEWQGVRPLKLKGSDPRLLMKRAAQLDRANAAAAADAAGGVGGSSTDEGRLLLSVSTGNYFSSNPKPVLLLDVDKDTAAELNAMYVGSCPCSMCYMAATCCCEAAPWLFCQSFCRHSCAQGVCSS